MENGQDPSPLNREQLPSFSREPPASAGPPRIVFLIDESAIMRTPVADGTKAKAESVATAINSLLNQLSTAPEIDVALVGYRGNATGDADAGCRWGGPLAGRTFVAATELADAPVAVENRVRKAPTAGSAGAVREETVRFPVWYVPELGDTAPMAAGYQCVYQLLADQPGQKLLLIGIVGELRADDGFRMAVAQLRQLPLAGGAPLLFHFHLAPSARVPATLYPSSDGRLPSPEAHELFHASSPLPDLLAAELRKAQLNVNSGARGVVFNGKMADLIRFLGLVKSYACSAGVESMDICGVPPALPAAPMTPAPQASETTPALIILLLDRCVTDPSDSQKQGVWLRLQEHANQLLDQIARQGKGRLAAAMISYGDDGHGQTDLRTTFAGPLAERLLVSDAELAAGPLRVEKATEKVSNGIGGLIEVQRQRPIFVDLPATADCNPLPALDAVAGLVAGWSVQHPAGPPPVVLHLTRGRSEPLSAGCFPQGAAVYHLVVTESPHRSLAYPAQPAEIDDSSVLKLWELSSPLLGAARLAATRPAVAAESRGLVVNGKFDLLLDGIL